MSLLLPPFELHEPETVEDAVKVVAEHPGDVDFVAGGTDLLPNYKWGLNARKHVVSLGRIPELRRLDAGHLGAMVRLTELVGAREVNAVHPVIGQAAHLIASPLLRNAGTVGGNVMLENRCFYFNQSYLWRKHKDFCLKADGDKCLVVPQKETCYATFSADLPGPFLTLDATYHFVGPDGKRDVKARDFYQGDGIERNVRRAGEMLTHVTLPDESRGLVSRYEKLRLRGTFDFPECGIAVSARFDGDTMTELHLCANALEMVPKMLPEVTEAHVGSALTDEVIEEIAAGVVDNVRPVRNTAMPPAYRKKMAGVFAKRALRGVRDEAFAAR